MQTGSDPPTVTTALFVDVAQAARSPEDPQQPAQGMAAQPYAKPVNLLAPDMKVSRRVVVRCRQSVGIPATPPMKSRATVAQLRHTIRSCGA